MLRFLFFVFVVTQLNTACAKRNYTDDISTSLVATNNDQNECPYYFTKEALCLRIEWEVDPSSNGYSSLVMSFYKKESLELVDPQKTPFVFLWMSSMGHGSTPVTMEKISTGKYRASNIYFVMPGTWDIRYQLKSGSAIIEQHVQTIKI